MGKQPSNSISLRKFNMRLIADDSIVAYIGKRRSGKSFCLKDMLYHLKDIPCGTVISPTEKYNPFFADFIPKTYHHDEYNDIIVKDIHKRQEMLIKKKIPGADERFFLILDDCLADNSWAKSKWIRSVFMNGRHLKLFFVFTSQYPLGVPPNLRGNIDYSFLMHERNYQNRRKLFDCYASVFPSFDDFCKTMDSLEEFECLVIKNTGNTSNLEDCVFWYKATDRGEYKMGCEQYWENHKRTEMRRRTKHTRVHQTTNKKGGNLTIKKIG